MFSVFIMVPKSVPVISCYITNHSKMQWRKHYADNIDWLMNLQFWKNLKKTVSLYSVSAEVAERLGALLVWTHTHSHVWWLRLAVSWELIWAVVGMSTHDLPMWQPGLFTTWWSGWVPRGSIPRGSARGNLVSEVRHYLHHAPFFRRESLSLAHA